MRALGAIKVLGALGAIKVFGVVRVICTLGALGVLGALRVLGALLSDLIITFSHVRACFRAKNCLLNFVNLKPQMFTLFITVCITIFNKKKKNAVSW